jgi:hypothetical protein
MTLRAHRTATLALALTLTATASALAAGALNGKTYEGGAPSSGVSEGHHVRTYAAGNIILRVSGNGKSVSVRFSSSSPVIYCRPQGPIRVQTSHPASISANGTFKASVGERFSPGPGPPAIVQVVSGQFSGRGVRGTIRTQTGEFCSGVSHFSASAR